MSLAAGCRLIAAGASAALALLAPTAGADSIWDGDGPWGPGPEFGTQPVLGAPIPQPEPLGAYDDADFDSDGVANVADNCLLVSNPGQAPAELSPGATPVGPEDMLALSAEWKAAHPGARFRDDAELGRACSGYNRNYMRTTKALIAASDERKIEIFRFLGQSGPMFGGSPDPLASNPGPGPGNLTPSLPMCSSWAKWAQLPDWILSGFENPHGIMGELASGVAAQDDCGPTLRGAWDQAMRHAWAGKRLYTNAAGGRITNRFFPSVTEARGFDGLAELTATLPLVRDLKLFPYPNGQTRHGLIFRGRSYVDGREAILMDWRGLEGYPANAVIPRLGGWLIYDECRAIQTGVYHCTAVIDIVAGERRLTWQEGYMPWVTKGPPTIEEYIAATRYARLRRP